MDAVEVVRCRDCVNLDYHDHGEGTYCRLWDVDGYEEAIVCADDFCSDGERKKGEESFGDKE